MFIPRTHDPDQCQFQLPIGRLTRICRQPNLIILFASVKDSDLAALETSGLLGTRIRAFVIAFMIRLSASGYLKRFTYVCERGPLRLVAFARYPVGQNISKHFCMFSNL